MSTHLPRLVALAVTLIGAGHAAADWLTPGEREFFHAMGGKVMIDDKSQGATYRPERIENLAKEVDEPLRGRAAAFIRARRAMQTLNADGSRAAQHHADAVNDLAFQVPKDPKLRQGAEFEAKFVNLLAKHPSMTKAWFAERDRLDEGLKTLDAEAGQLTAILDDVAKRIGKKAEAPPFRIEVKPGIPTGGDHLWIIGRPGAGFAEGAVLQILVHTPPAKGSWDATIMHRNLRIWPIGNDLALRAQQADADIGAELTKLQERVKDRPSLRTYLVPAVADGAVLKCDLMLPGSLSHYIDRIEVRSWCKAGASTIESVPGLDVARKRTRKDEADKLMPPRDVTVPAAAAGAKRPTPPAVGPTTVDPQLRPGKSRTAPAGKFPVLPPPPNFSPKDAAVLPKDGRSVPKPDNSQSLLYSGSLWKGSYPGRLSPKGKSITIEFAVTKGGWPDKTRAGRFEGTFLLRDESNAPPEEGTMMGEITAEGEVTWHQFRSRTGLKEIFTYRATFVKDGTLKVERLLEGKLAKAWSFDLEYVPPK
jgi:hypothetical protein